jgi:hypothetical protein
LILNDGSARFRHRRHATTCHFGEECAFSGAGAASEDKQAIHGVRNVVHRFFLREMGDLSENETRSTS